MTLQELGIKDLEYVCLKTRNEISFGNRVLEAGEPVLYFENIQISLLSEQVRPVMARGGWGNEPHVIWEDRQETVFAFSNGTVNTTSLNLLLNAEMVEKKEATPFFFREKDLIIDKYGIITLKYPPAEEKKKFFYIYGCENIQTRIIPESINGRKVVFDKKYIGQNVLCDYYFYNSNDAIFYTMARERFTNLYSLEATFLMKDENEGLLHTGLLRMPKVRVVSNINLRMGERVDPAVSTFNIIAMPERLGDKDAVVCEIVYLDKDIAGI